MAELCAYLNALPEAEARAALMRCCGSQSWASAMLASRPFASAALVFESAERLWSALSEAEVLEAFAHHPRIGENIELLRARYAAQGAAPDAGAFSVREQAKVAEASEATLLALQHGNRAYEQRFGFIFLIFASGKSADEMLALLNTRLSNDRPSELANARREHAKITQLRLSKLAR